MLLNSLLIYEEGKNTDQNLAKLDFQGCAVVWFSSFSYGYLKVGA